VLEALAGLLRVDFGGGHVQWALPEQTLSSHAPSAADLVIGAYVGAVRPSADPAAAAVPEAKRRYHRGSVVQLDGESRVVEVRFEDGTTAKFLHLNEVGVKVGQSIIAGTEVGKSGNTGRSTAAHLHYQLEKDGKVIDPLAYHGTLRRQLGPAALNALTAQVTEYEAALDGRVAAR
jgi:hypothetical protein